MVVAAAVGFFGVRLCAELMLPVPGAKLLKFASFIALPFLWFGVIGFHELGHLAGGWLVGGRFLLWGTGPLMIRRTPAGLRWSWNRSVNATGGMAACVPRDPRAMTPRRAVVMVLGGPLASLLLAGGGIMLAILLSGGPSPVPLARVFLQHAAVLATGLSLLVFVVAAFPAAVGGFRQTASGRLNCCGGTIVRPRRRRCWSLPWRI
jgi:hypothetical protein